MSPSGASPELNGWIDEHDLSDDEDADDFDPDRLAECAYWRCGELFEMRTSNQIYCRKACRSRQNKWERAQERRRRREAARAAKSRLD